MEWREGSSPFFECTEGVNEKRTSEKDGKE